MLRKLLCAGVLLTTLAGCTDPEGRKCRSDADCGDGGTCNVALELCYATDTEPELDAGVCMPACAEYEACTKNGCRARFTGVAIQTPSSNALLDAGAVQVVAQLQVNETYRVTTRFPEALDFRAELNGGGSGGDFTNFSHDDAGTYSAVWTPPVVEAQVTLRASHPVPNAGVSSSVVVSVDRVPPTLTVTVPSPNVPVLDGGTVYADPNPNGLTNLWRRDQQIPIEIRTNEANLDVGSLRVALRGTDGVASASVAVTPTTTNCTALFCGVALLNLWEPKFDLFRGSMTLEVQGNDLAGNVGSTSPATPQVNVTRWKWAFNLSTGAIKASPAIGEKGTVYIGSADGKVIALSPEGSKTWEASTVGAVGSLAVGTSDGGVEPIYVATNTTNSKGVLYALSSDDGGVRVRCPGSGEHAGSVLSAMAITTFGTAPSRFEQGAAVVNNGKNSELWVVRPEGASSTAQCVLSSATFNIPEATQDGSLVADGGTFVYPTSDATIVSYSFGGSALNWETQPASQLIVGLALAGGNLLGGGVGSTPTQGALYSVPMAGSMNVTLLPSTSGGRVWSPIIGPGGILVFHGQETGGNQGNLKKYDLQSQMPSNSMFSNVGVLKYAPALGADGLLYAAPSSSGSVSALSTGDLSQQWTEALNAPATASVGLDCARSTSGAVIQGKPSGTLYVPSGGVLNAIIVDSPGLSRDTAAWPKYQHDARNTGNPATPITNCQ
ncbi:PQQ-binding-like beta-propeller repeat protein [Hyalangium versicolor]|uniref:PQQ-binding-like beta-propeller repeat protein n=1 Tax=Hyalangium versicolor TaxID=2861190 RepID=UPI001CCDDE7D|nr:PQQ-binding-like beta-propeller repeat protein [Hyalangium versicolor]